MKIITTTPQDTHHGVMPAWSNTVKHGHDLRQLLARRLAMQDFRDLIPGIELAHCKRLNGIDVVVEDDLLHASAELLGNEIAKLVAAWKAGTSAVATADDLTTIDGIDRTKADRIAAAGFDSFAKLRDAPAAAIKSLKLGPSAASNVLEWQKGQKKMMDTTKFENKAMHHASQSKAKAKAKHASKATKKPQPEEESK